MDFNNDSNEKDNASWYVEEPPKSGDDTGGRSGSGSPEGDGPDNIHRIFIRIEPNTMLITTCMMLGIIAVIAAAFGSVYLPFICGGVSIIMAVLSRDRDGKLDKKCLIGILLSTLAIVVDIVTVTVTVYGIFHDPEQYEAFNRMFENVYGQDFETFTNNSIQVWK